MRALLFLLLAICAGGAFAGAHDDANTLLVMLRAPAVHDTPEAGYVGDYRNAPGHQARARIARKLAAANGLTVRSDWAMPALGVDCYVLQARDAQAAAGAVEALARDPRVESVQPMQQFEVLGDPLAPAQPAQKLWKLDEVHRHATGRGITVAVIDSGVAASHADLRGQVAQSRDFVIDDAKREVPETHGTEVAGLIAARADNDMGIAGVAPGARLLALRACWQSDRSGRARCNSFTLAKALQFAIEQRAQVINLSLGGPRDVLLARLIDVATARGANIVAAVDPRARDGGFPASMAGVIAVAGEPDRALPMRTFLAPADALPTTTLDGGWGLVNGTSFAAAQVSGLIALLRDAAPKLRGPAVRDALAGTAALGSVPARPLPIDACAAFARAGPGCACGCRLADAQETPRH
ncbi:Subtilisin-like serine protease protein [Lysobacter dokdonensis DS-58]|uniref:Subtilisin-like serine protease protein n=1 Tax=Lysobacter dokdonensis DS-58 TaxID=1300345 RepID=A0A0A2WZ54_9GAMM|nr:S8 family serine peptidase [Lysobacter dokdonensis]KGQ18254.1 Subtilisin-like serine protease protein [Lysobacter dokdonensis DS-58]